MMTRRHYRIAAHYKLRHYRIFISKLLPRHDDEIKMGQEQSTSDDDDIIDYDISAMTFSFCMLAQSLLPPKLVTPNISGIFRHARRSKESIYFTRSY